VRAPRVPVEAACRQQRGPVEAPRCRSPTPRRGYAIRSSATA